MICINSPKVLRDFNSLQLRFNSQARNGEPLSSEDTMARQKIGRNDPCPCGSGQKFKRCCLGKSRSVQPTFDPESARLAEQHFREHTRREAERRRRFGEVRQPIATVHQGYRFVAVGSRLYYNKNWNTFTDFLLFYVRDVMGKVWWDAEMAKPVGERHPVVRWFDHWLEMSRQARREENGLLSAVPDGTMSALMLLAYDLYVLRHHAKLQDEVVARLRQTDQFHGARYELFVAASFVRAGFDFEYEDETDTTRKHAEFVATFRSDGYKAAVEAKARRRKVSAASFDVTTIRPGVKELLVNAASKTTDIPLIVFVELNLPPEGSQRPSWLPEVESILAEIAAENGGQSPFAAVIFTNRPHVYGLPGEPDPAHHVYAMWPGSAGLPEHLVEALGTAAHQYGNVPSLFPDDFPQPQEGSAEVGS